MRRLKPSEAPQHAWYPNWERGFRSETPEHEAQVRYLRDALTVLFPQHHVVGGQAVLGWTGEGTVYTAPDVLVWWDLANQRHCFDLRHSDAKSPHLNEHPAERPKCFCFVLDVNDGSPRFEDELLMFGFGAYVHFNQSSGGVTALRLADRQAFPVEQEGGRFRFADEQISFGVETVGTSGLEPQPFLWVFDWDGTRLPRYQDAVSRPPSPLGAR